MEETMLKSNALMIAEKNMLDYFQTHDVKYIREDAVFRNMGTGEVHKGKAEIGAMLHYIYQVAFDARAEMSSYIVTENKAQVEGLFKGRHIGEIQGIPPTNKEVTVPLCVTYDLQDGLIKEARIYMQINVLLRQLCVNTITPPPKTTFVVRDIFQLKFGQYRAAKKLLDEAVEKKLLPEAELARVLTDFTGNAYRLVFEEGFQSLTDYEESLTSSMRADEWQAWYEQFKPLVESSHREILKQVI